MRQFTGRGDSRIQPDRQQSSQDTLSLGTGGGYGHPGCPRARESAAGPFHSQSNEAWFTHTPGLKVVVLPQPLPMPRGCLIAAINDPNPVLYFEHKALYRSISGPVPEEYYAVEIGKARHGAGGRRIFPSLRMVRVCIGRWNMRPAHPRSFYRHPGSADACSRWTSMLLRRAVWQGRGGCWCLHEDTLTGGIGAEIAAWICEHCFRLLDAPVHRCASLDTPVPFNQHELEEELSCQGPAG